MASVINAFVNPFNNRLEAPLRQHLKNVYACLSLAAITAAAGAYIHLFTEILQANMLTTIGTCGLLLALVVTPDNGKNQKLRLSYLLGFAFLSGLGLGPLLSIVISVSPSIIVTALIGTTVIFLSFSISALLAEQGHWLYLGGILISMLNMMVMSSFLNIFLRWSFLNQIHIHVGLFLMCGFIIYDTQLIIEKFHMGSKDFILHSLDLLIDYIGVFRHLLLILTQKEVSKYERKQRNNKQ